MCEVIQRRGVRTVGVHGNRPVDEEQVDVGRLEHVEALLQALLGTRVESAPQLAGDEEILALDDAARNDVLQGIANLVLVLVAEGAVNVAVAGLDGVNDGFLDLAGGRLPGAQAEGGDGGAGVEGDGSVHGGLWVQDVGGRGLKDQVGEGEIHGGGSGVGYMYACVVQLRRLTVTVTVTVMVVVGVLDSRWAL